MRALLAFLLLTLGILCLLWGPWKLFKSSQIDPPPPVSVVPTDSALP